MTYLTSVSILKSFIALNSHIEKEVLSTGNFKREGNKAETNS